MLKCFCSFGVSFNSAFYLTFTFFLTLYFCQALVIIIQVTDFNFQFQQIAFLFILDLSQPAFTCSKLTIEILEQGVKYVQS